MIDLGNLLEFTNHHLIAAAADPGWAMSRLGEASGADLGRAMQPDFMSDLGRTLVPEGELVWAQVRPASVASLRVFLAARFRPGGAEVHFTEDSSGPPR